MLERERENHRIKENIKVIQKKILSIFKDLMLSGGCYFSEF